MSEKNKNRNPWEDRFGKLLPDDVLRIVSKCWSAEMWENYLKTVEVSLRENFTPLSKKLIATLESDNKLTFENDEIISSTKLSISKSKIKKAISGLTFRQQRIIDEIFFKGKTLKEAAKALEISKRAAFLILNRALSRLRKNFAILLRRGLK